MTDFRDKVVVITGASTGIGRATAVAFRQAGARVALAARSATILEDLSTELGGPDVALPIPTDVTDPDQCRALMQRAADHFGRIDVLINNAGMLVSGKFEHLEPGDMERQFAVNYFGVVYCTQAALPFLKQTRGVIVLVSSVAGLIATPTTSAYAASKAAVNSLGRSLAAELSPTGVTVSTVCPYFTSGAQLSAKGIIRAGSRHRAKGPKRRKAPGTQTLDQVAQAIVRAAARRPRLMVLSLAGRVVWRIDRFAPWFTDWVLAQAARRM